MEEVGTPPEIGIPWNDGMKWQRALLQNSLTPSTCLDTTRVACSIGGMGSGKEHGRRVLHDQGQTQNLLLTSPTLGLSPASDVAIIDVGRGGGGHIGTNLCKSVLQGNDRHD